MVTYPKKFAQPRSTNLVNNRLWKGPQVLIMTLKIVFNMDNEKNGVLFDV